MKGLLGNTSSLPACRDGLWVQKSLYQYREEKSVLRQNLRTNRRSTLVHGRQSSAEKASTIGRPRRDDGFLAGASFGVRSKELQGAQKHANLTVRNAQEDVPTMEQLLQFERRGHLCLRGFLPQEGVQALEPLLMERADVNMLNAFRHRISVLCPGTDPFSVKSVKEAENVIRLKGTSGVGFLQMFNLHRESEELMKLASFPPLCRTVAKLLGAKRVRLYQDCLFLKLPGHGVTNWHSDLNMVPLDTNAFVTVWMPLRALSSSDSSLQFASGSHRDFALAYWQSNEGMTQLEGRGYSIDSYSQLDTGDITIHHGWTLHWAPPQPTTHISRPAWTISYFADGARVLSTKHARRKLQEEDTWSFQPWRKQLREGQKANHPMLPIVFRGLPGHKS